jgi:hypothetical protein
VRADEAGPAQHEDLLRASCRLIVIGHDGSSG